MLRRDFPQNSYSPDRRYLRLYQKRQRYVQYMLWYCVTLFNTFLFVSESLKTEQHRWRSCAQPRLLRRAALAWQHRPTFCPQSVQHQRHQLHQPRDIIHAQSPGVARSPRCGLIRARSVHVPLLCSLLRQQARPARLLRRATSRPDFRRPWRASDDDNDRCTWCHRYYQRTGSLRGQPGRGRKRLDAFLARGRVTRDRRGLVKTRTTAVLSVWNDAARTREFSFSFHDG